MVNEDGQQNFVNNNKALEESLILGILLVLLVLQHVMSLKVDKDRVKIVLVKVHKVQLETCCHEI